ncbi:MAG TPA: hypothetical protein VIQ02_13825 [Jiangellaceae bacterium]|jgi:type II secretory pathway pseudopilin PulG
MSTLVLAIVGVFFLGVAVSLYLWSRWSEREAAYEAEELSQEEGNLYRLGIALGANQGWGGGVGS